MNSLFYCECTAKLLHLYTRGCGEGGCFVSERVSEGCEAEAPVPGRRAYWRRLNTRTMGSFDQNDAPKTCGLLSPWQPPMGQGAGWQLERRTYKNGVHFFPLKLPCSISFRSSSCPPLLYECGLHLILQLHEIDLTGSTRPPTTHPRVLQTKRNSWRDHRKSSLYWLLLPSVIREHWSHWQIWGWAARFHTHCTLDFTPHFKTDEHFLYRHKGA